MNEATGPSSLHNMHRPRHIPLPASSLLRAESATWGQPITALAHKFQLFCPNFLTLNFERHIHWTGFKNVCSAAEKTSNAAFHDSINTLTNFLPFVFNIDLFYAELDRNF